MRTFLSLLFVLAVATLVPGEALAACNGLTCEQPEVTAGAGALTAAYVAQTPDQGWVATNTAPAAHPYTYRLLNPCVVATDAGDPCQDNDDRACPALPGQVVSEFLIQQRRLVLPTGTTVDGFPVPAGTPIGEAV